MGLMSTTSLSCRRVPCECRAVLGTVVHSVRACCAHMLCCAGHHSACTCTVHAPVVRTCRYFFHAVMGLTKEGVRGCVRVCASVLDVPCFLARAAMLPENGLTNLQPANLLNHHPPLRFACCPGTAGEQTTTTTPVCQPTHTRTLTLTQTQTPPPPVSMILCTPAAPMLWNLTN